jgi:4-aminobutyrate aminotransferase-like enzyme
LWFAVELANKEATIKAAATCVQNGVITDWFLFNEKCLRLAPPLCISYEELAEMIKIVLISLD